MNKKAVNWNGASASRWQNYRVRDALDCYCTGTNWCYVAAHSAGDLQIGYALALYGGSTRNKKNATPNASGVCGNAGGTQTGWNIKWVDVAGGAGGGSELADLGDWAVERAARRRPGTTTARAMYNHNTTRGIWFYMFAGAKGTAYSGILPGQDDEAVAYHSTGGVSGSSGSSMQPGRLVLRRHVEHRHRARAATAPAKWSYHSVKLRDDGEAYNHYANGSWASIVGVVRSDVVTNAK